MDFHLEIEMKAPTIKWMRSEGLTVRQELTTPWGPCDLVGISIDEIRALHRVSLRQLKPIGSPLRARVLELVPDSSNAPIINRDDVKEHFDEIIDRTEIDTIIDSLIQHHYIRSGKNGKLHRLNGWTPIHNRLVTVELKLSRIEEVMMQARNHLSLTWESYIGVPLKLASQLAGSARRKDFFDQGLGLLGVSASGCDVLISPRPRKTNAITTDIQMSLADRFWTQYVKDSLSLTVRQSSLGV